MVGVLCPHVFGSADACLLTVFSILSVVKNWVRQVGAQNITLSISTIVACIVVTLAIIIALHELQ